MAGGPADIQVIADGRNSNTAGTALTYVSAIVDSFNANWAADHGGTAPALSVTMRAWYNPNLETRWYMVPALIGTLTLLQTLLLTAHVRRPRARAGHFRPASGDAVSAGGDHRRQGPAVDVDRDDSGDLDPAGGAALVPHPLRRLLRDPLYRPCALSAGGRWHRPHAVVGRRHHAAGHALRLRRDDAVGAPFGADDADQQHARNLPIPDTGQSLASTRSTSRIASISKARASAS